MLTILPQILTGDRIQLEPLNESHKNELYTVAQDESIWTYLAPQQSVRGLIIGLMK